MKAEAANSSSGTGKSFLADRAEVRAPAGEQYSADGSAADQAGLAGPEVDAVLKLEKAAYAVGIHVVGDGRAAERNRMLQDFLQGRAKAVKFSALDAAGHAFGTDSGAEEAFVGVDIAHAVEQRLIEQRRFDGQLAAAKELSESLGSDGGWLRAGSEEGFGAIQFTKFKTPEAAGIDEAHLTSAGQGQARVGMRLKRALRRGYEQAAGHAEVNDPLGRRSLAARVSQIADNVLADAADSEDRAAFESGGLFGWRIFEWLRVGAEPDLDDAVAAQPLVDTAGYGFDFR